MFIYNLCYYQHCVYFPGMIMTKAQTHCLVSGNLEQAAPGDEIYVKVLSYNLLHMLMQVTLSNS